MSNDDLQKDSQKSPGFFGIVDRMLRIWEAANTTVTNTLIVAAVLALGFGGWKVYQATSWMWNLGGKATQVVSESIDSAKQNVGDVVDASREKIDNAGESASEVLNAGKNLVVDGTGAVVDGAGKIGNTVVDTVQDAGTAVTDTTEKVTSTVRNITEQGGDVAQGVIEGASKVLTDRTLIPISDQEVFGDIAATAFQQVVSTPQSVSLGFVNNKRYLSGADGKSCEVMYAEGNVAVIAADQDAYAQGKAVHTEPEKTLRWAILGEGRNVLMGFNTRFNPEAGWTLRWNKTTISQSLSHTDAVQAAKTVLQSTSSCTSPS